ncbi:hypothetical protein FACS189451_04800 [Bacteroidia bacterium]|nr:hypothetical protein FACS189451_04800 [Bacteroidia bacterium]
MGKWRNKKKSKMFRYRKCHSLIESDTVYCKELLTTKNTFEDIRNLSVCRYRSLDDAEQNRLYSSLENGEAILNEENQICTYMYAYGNMHKAKLLSAFEAFPDISSKVNIIDWSCGQGIASMIFLEKYGCGSVNHITLIEPSEIALKRAALHCKKYCPDISLKTICKEINNVKKQDFSHSKSAVTIHLFSNILDMHCYSQEKLIELLKKIQSGVNYFVCVSPYINATRAQKLETFKTHFQNNYHGTYALLEEQTNTKDLNNSFWYCNNRYKDRENPFPHGRYTDCDNLHSSNGCSKKWTRDIKVFKVILE